MSVSIGDRELTGVEVALVQALEGALLRVGELEATLVGINHYAATVRGRPTSRAGAALDALRVIEEHSQEVLAAVTAGEGHEGEEAGCPPPTHPSPRAAPSI